MHLIKSEEIDRKKWDTLVSNSPNATMYNQSIFLDTLAENWMLLVNDDYSMGLPIPYTVRLGVKGIYTPNFCRDFSFLGYENLTESQVQISVQLLQKEFRYCSLNLAHNYFKSPVSKKVYQYLEGTHAINSQVKRAIKKFEKSNLKIVHTELITVLPIISKELSTKVKNLKEIDLERFEKVCQSIPSNETYILGVKNDNEWLGGLVFTFWKNKMLYLKGGSKELAKQEGAMFAMMKQAIEYSVNTNLIVDFGGSNVEGVQRFNKSFGAIDREYVEWKWDQSPKWFAVVRKLKKIRLKPL